MQSKVLGPKRIDSRGILRRAVTCEALELRRLLSVTAPSNIPATVFSVTTYGALGNGASDTTTVATNTTAIQNAINAAAANSVGGFSGGIVDIPAASGAYVSGPITLANNVDLQIDSGAELQAEPMAQYPGVGTGSITPFITSSSKSNFEITGSGTIDGNGAAWWAAFNANSSITRPYLIKLSNSNIVLVQGVTLQNSPMFHLAFSSTNNVTVNSITVNTSNTSPNTDGIDPAGMHYLIENCNISTGDDNIAIKPQSVACGDITVTGCTFGFGHGLSVGGETNDGLNGLTVTNCTFNGTTSGIRLKAERTMGGLVQNVSYSNLTMSNVQYPININSYYNIGTIPSTPTDPAQPITSLTPIWENISISNVTVTNPPSSSYAGVIWGLPEEPVMNVTLTNVQTTGQFGFDLDHVRGIHFDGKTTITATGGGGQFISSKTAATPYDAAYWTDQDVNAPAVAGNAAFDLTSHNFTLSGTGASIGAGATDQFNFNSTNLANSGTLIAQINSQSSTNTAAEAGIMIRNTIANNSAFAAVLLTPGAGGGLSFLTRTTNGTLASTVVAGQTAAVWVKLVDNANSFTAFYGTNGTTWTQIGSAVSISMGTNTLAGLAVNSGDNSTVDMAVFANVEFFSILTGAFASVSPVITTSTLMSVFAADVLSDSGLTYTWSAPTLPTGAVAPTFSPNGTNPAAFSTTTFTSAGIYGLLVTIHAASGLSMTSSVNVTVSQTLTSITVSPTTSALHEDGTQTFTATGLDQFAKTMSPEPTFAWALVSGIGGINSSTGLYTAPAAAGSATVHATASSITSSTASITVTNAAPTVATPAAATPSPATGTSTNLSVLGADDAGESNLIYTWAATTIPTGASAPNFSINGTNASKNSTATFSQAGSYSFTVTIKDSGGLTVTSSVTVVVNQTLTSIKLSPSSTSLNENGTQSFTATALDQFQIALVSQPTFSWSLASGIGGINSSSGLYTAPAAAGSATVQATANSITSLTAAVTVNNGTPTVATPAAANPSPAIGTTTGLSVLGADDGGESNLIYTWAATTIPTGASAPNFSINGTNASKNSTVTFSQAGSYSFTVTIKDSGGLTVTSSVNVVVNQTLTSIKISPSSVFLSESDAQPFSAMALDQFQTAMVSQPTFSWSLASGIGGINVTTGVYTAPAAAGSASVQATASSITSSPSAITVTAPTTYSAADTYYVELAADQSTEQIWVGSNGIGSPTYTSPISSLASLTFSGGPDNLTVDFTNDDAVPASGIAFSGAGSLKIIGSAGNDTINVGATAVTFDNDTPITYPAGASITVDGGAGADVFTQSAQPSGSATLSFLPTVTDTLNINAGLYNIPAPAVGSGFNVYPLSQLNIANGANMAVGTADGSGDRTVLVLNNLSIGSTGKLDLGGNDMIDQGDSLSSVTSLIASGFNAAGAWWSGDGLTSALAASTGQALGVAVNVSGNSFDGMTVGPTDVLVKYTMFGDADLSGSIDATDYQLIDNGYNNSLAGWQNGDFNYDSVVNGDDYTLIDNSYNTQPVGPAPVAVAAPQAQVAPAHVAPAVFASSPQIAVDQLSQHRHIKRLADWLSDSSQTYVQG